MSQYASQTTVPVERSRAEIMGVLDRYGCDGISTHQTQEAWGIEFYVHNRKVRFAIEHPEKADRKYSETPSGRRKRNTQSKNKAWEQDLRQIYRALCLIIKAKLEYVESGHAIFEREFMANIVDPVTGKTMGEVVQPLIADRYEGIDNRPALFLPEPTE